jgi:5-methylcytosine-specific restriction protein A
MREDKGKLVLPLRDKGYVIRTITFGVEQVANNRAICTPHRLRILHDNNEIDLTERLMSIAALLAAPGLPPEIQSDAAQYKAIVSGGVPSVGLRQVASRLAAWFEAQPELNEVLEAPSENFIVETAKEEPEAIALTDLSVDETTKRLVSHYRIDRSPKIRAAKVDLFTAQNGSVYCENCTFSFEEKYGQRGKGYIEVHHVQPLAALLPNVVTKLSDLMLLCANCHRMVHRKPLLSPDDLRSITVM